MPSISTARGYRMSHPNTGVAFEHGEQQNGVAVPVKRNEHVISAVYVAGSSDRLKSKRFEEDTSGMISSTVTRFVPEL